MADLASLLRSARHEAGLTQAELAERVGVRQSTIAALERPGANPTIRTVERVLVALDRKLELRAAPQKSSIDETLIIENLKLTPAERLRQFEQWMVEVQWLEDVGRRHRERLRRASGSDD